MANTPTKSIGAPKTSRSRTKTIPKKKESAESDGLSSFTNDDEKLKSPSAARGKSGKRQLYIDLESEEEQDNVPMSKRVKVEPLDDENDESYNCTTYDDREEEEV